MSWLIRLDYLDLASQYPFKQIVTTYQNKYLCYFRTINTSYITHSESAHLNSIIDLLLIIEVNLDNQLKETLKILEILKTEVYKQNQILKDPTQNIDYLRSFQKNLNLRCLSRPQRRDVVRLASVIKENKLRNFELQNKDLLALKTLVTKTKEQINLQIGGIYKILKDIKYK